MSLRPKLFTIPNIITCFNLLCGCIAIALAIGGKTNLVYASYFIFLATLFDFFDGFTARLFKSYTETGKELDSLADMVSFGIAPSIIMLKLMMMTMRVKDLNISTPKFQLFILSLAFLVAIFSALRLAKFNVDKRQTDSFIGLPTPANAIFIASLPLIIEFDPSELILFPKLGDNIYFFLAVIFLTTVVLKLYILIPITLISAFLLICEFPMFSLKFKNYSFADNKIRYIFLFLSITALLVFQALAIPAVVFLYILLSFIKYLGQRRREKIAKKNLERILAKNTPVLQ